MANPIKDYNDDKKKIVNVYKQPINQTAGTRDANGVDEPTCFGIPGSGLPRRHCNVDLNVSVAVASDLSVYISLHNGKIHQKVYGQGYECKMFVCPHPFTMTIPTGVTGWGDAKTNANGGQVFSHVQFSNNGDRCDDDVFCLTQGSLRKSYDVSVPFEWQFSDCVQLTPGQSYDEESEILVQKIYRVSQNGGYSESDSSFVKVGRLIDFNWTQQMGTSQNGAIYLCGGILYPGSKITSAITAVAVKIEIEGLNLAAYYYPGDIRKNERMSLNRPGGYLRIYQPSLQPEYLTGINDPDAAQYPGWRPVKNTENDKGVAAGTFDNYGYRLEGDTWVRLIITGKGGQTDEELEDQGIGSDSPGSSGSSNGRCPCCQMK